jgi:stearoyl-CoA desaturase (delta-9 desaturase)
MTDGPALLEKSDTPDESRRTAAATQTVEPRPAAPAAEPRTEPTREPSRNWAMQILQWFDTSTRDEWVEGNEGGRQQVEWARCIPFAILHLMCLGVIWVGVSPVAVGVAVAMYVVRMFAITGFYHRYFSHKTFKTTRAGQFAMALLGATATQRGPLWWASHHRLHHKNSDQPEDVHSPKQHGFWWSHMGWITCKANFPIRWDAVKDLSRYPELRFLDRFDTLVPILTGAAMFFLGMALDALWPSLGTSAGQMLIWGYFISTVALMHGTFTINSLSHVFGWRRYETTDTSKNNPLLALITLGEGWHNNHHYYQSSARNGFYWWEVDLIYYGLKVLSWLGLVWDLRPVPSRIRDARPKRRS